MPDPFKLKFNFDVSTIRLLGRELITDRITALFELVKNCYDANSDHVTLYFNNVGCLENDSYICLEDDGLGMSLYDIRYKWMVVGTNSKRKESISPSPYKRKVVGEKGVGRFAVEKLGSKVVIETTQRGTTRKVKLELDWDKYESISSEQMKKNNRNAMFFTEVENNCWIETCSREEQGTKIKIFLSKVEQLWSENDIKRACSELAKLISPLFKPLYPFSIRIISNEYEQFKSKDIINNFTIDTSHHYVLNPIIIDGEQLQEYLFFDDKKEELVVRTNKRIFGPVSLDFYYLDKNDIRKYKTAFRGDRVDGIIIYRDGIITTPFAENETDPNKKRDILGIDKRRYSGFFEKISSNNLIGYLNITKEDNPKIKDATNRQDFIDCEEYRELKEYIIEQIEALEKYLSNIKKKESLKTATKLIDANLQLNKISTIISEISGKTTPEVRNKLSEIKKKTEGVQRDLSKGIKQYEQLRNESQQREDLFFSLLSLQDYAAELSHMVKTTVGNVKGMAEFFYSEFPNPQYEDIFKEYAKLMFTELDKLSIGVRFMLSYASSGSDFETFEVFSLIGYLFDKVYNQKFKEEGINTILEYDKELQITHNRKFFEDIFENLISNSIKAMKHSSNKIIKCTGTVEDAKMSIRFSDTGCGIPEEDWESVFEIFKTTTQNEGGAGIGLFTVKKRIEALNGEVKIIKPEFVDVGATFLITLPFKK